MTVVPEPSPAIQQDRMSRRFAAIAAAILVVQKTSSYLILSTHRLNPINIDLYLNVQSIICYWLFPLLAVYFIERKGYPALGITFGRFKPVIYYFLVAVALLLPALTIGVSRDFLFKVIEQILFIAFAEEVFWRGYFQKRLSDWIGSTRGLIITSILFGLGHLLSIHAVEGYLEFPFALNTFVQTTLGGFIFGLLFIWSGSIFPGAILHLFGNVFLSRFF